MSIEETFTVTVDGTDVTACPGETMLSAAKRAGVEIPTLCHDDRLDPMGSCRMCLIEVEGQRKLQAACAMPVQPDMVIETRSDRVARHRRTLLSLYLADHAVDEQGLPRQSALGNDLRTYVEAFGTGPSVPRVDAPRSEREDPNPYIHFDADACILCARCVRYCDEVEAVSAITLAGRGSATTIATAAQVSLLDSSCELCGGCIDTCPTGALSEKPSLDLTEAPETVVRSTCNFCGVGCQLDLHVHDNTVRRVTSPPPGTTLNDGNLCVKGRFSYEFIHHEDRLTTPLIRREDGELHPASWEEAIQAVADGLKRVARDHGTDSLGFISSSRCTGEENYLMQKLSRAAFGTNNCHQCAAT